MKHTNASGQKHQTCRIRDIGKFNIHLSLSYFKQNVESFLPVTQFQHGVAFLLCYVSAVWM